MPTGMDNLPDNKEERDSTLAKVMRLAPLFSLIIQILEFALKILRII